MSILDQQQVLSRPQSPKPARRGPSARRAQRTPAEAPAEISLSDVPAPRRQQGTSGVVSLDGVKAPTRTSMPIRQGLRVPARRPLGQPPRQFERAPEAAGGIIPAALRGGTHATLRLAGLVAASAVVLVGGLFGGARRTSRALGRGCVRIQEELRGPVTKVADSAATVGRRSIGAGQQALHEGARVVQAELRDMDEGTPTLKGGLRRVRTLVRSTLINWRVRISQRLQTAVEFSPSRIGRTLGQASFCVTMTSAFAAAAFLGWQGLAWSEFGEVQAVHVHGATHLSDELVRDIAHLAEGDPAVVVSLAWSKSRVERHPWVETATLRRRTPRSIHVLVEERVPALLVQTSAGGLLLADERGRLFKPREGSEGLGLPVVTGLSGLSVDTEVEHDSLQRAVQLHEALGRSLVLAPEWVGEIRVEEDGALSVVRVDGLPVRVGRDRFGPRLARLDQLHETGQLSMSEAAHIDLDLDRRVLVRRRRS